MGLIGRHKRLDKKVFLKKRKIHPFVQIKGLEKEILLQAKNRGIPSVFDEVMIEDETYLVMDYIEGKSLEECLREGEMTFFLFESLIETMVDLLFYFRSFKRGIVHGDIKPSNIMVSKEEIFLIDFDSSVFENQSGILLGCSPKYLPPWFKKRKGERKNIGPILDLYALLLTLLECLESVPFSKKKIYYFCKLCFLKKILFLFRRGKALWVLECLQKKKRKESRLIKRLCFILTLEVMTLFFYGQKKVENQTKPMVYVDAEEKNLSRKALSYFLNTNRYFTEEISKKQEKQTGIFKEKGSKEGIVKENIKRKGEEEKAKDNQEEKTIRENQEVVNEQGKTYEKKDTDEKSGRIEERLIKEEAVEEIRVKEESKQEDKRQEEGFVEGEVIWIEEMGETKKQVEEQVETKIEEEEEIHQKEEVWIERKNAD